MIILFTIGCPKCKILERKLNEKGIAYIVNDDVEAMKRNNINVLPVLVVDGVSMDFASAIDWVRKQ